MRSANSSPFISSIVSTSSWEKDSSASASSRAVMRGPRTAVRGEASCGAPVTFNCKRSPCVRCAKRQAEGRTIPEQPAEDAKGAADEVDRRRFAAYRPAYTEGGG